MSGYLVALLNKGASFSFQGASPQCVTWSNLGYFFLILHKLFRVIAPNVFMSNNELM